MARRFFILVPSLHPTGPVKGAVALANELAAHRHVTLVALKPGPGANIALEPRVNVVELGHIPGWLARLRHYQQLLDEAGGRTGAASISFCLSADLFNLISRSWARTCASVRGNLIQNYRMDYGLRGYPLAMAHLTLLRGLDHTVAMTSAMARQVRRYLGRPPEIIPNFVDERSLEAYRRTQPNMGGFRFVFLGSLSWRKQPLLLLEAFSALRQGGHDAHLHIIGSGPLAEELQERIRRLGLERDVTLHGQLADPYPVLSSADALVLPSLSEGMSRASLEALYLGIPCILRAADGNAELIAQGVNGVLFDEDTQLAPAMLQAARLARQRTLPTSLLPQEFRQASASLRYLTLLEDSRDRAL